MQTVICLQTKYFFLNIAESNKKYIINSHEVVNCLCVTGCSNFTSWFKYMPKYGCYALKTCKYFLLKN